MLSSGMERRLGFIHNLNNFSKKEYEENIWNNLSGIDNSRIPGIIIDLANIIGNEIVLNPDFKQAYDEKNDDLMESILFQKYNLTISEEIKELLLSYINNKNLSGLFDSIGDAFNNIWGGGGGFLLKVAKPIVEIAEIPLSVVGLSWEDLIPGWVRDAIDEVKSLPALIPAVSNIVRNVASLIEPALLAYEIGPVLTQFLTEKIIDLVKNKMLSIIIEEINDKIVDVIQQKISFLKKYVDVIPNVNTLVDSLNNLPELLKDKMSQTVDRFVNDISNKLLSPIIDKINVDIKDIISLINEFQNDFNKIKDLIEKDKTIGLSGTISNVVNQLNDISNKVSPAGIAAMLLDKIISPIVDQFMSGFIKQLIDDVINNYLSPIINEVATIIETVVSPLNAIEVPNIPDFDIILIDIFNPIDLIIDNLYKNVSGIFNDLYDKIIKPQLDIINNFIRNNLSQLNEIISWAEKGFDALQEIKSLPKLVPAVDNILKNVSNFENVTDLFSGLGPTILRIIKNKIAILVKDRIIGIFTSEINNQLKDAVEIKLQELNRFKDFLPEVQAFADNILYLPSLLQQTTSDYLNNYATELTNNINQSLQDFQDQANDINIDIIGIQGRLQSIQEKYTPEQVSGLSGVILDTVNKINSVTDLVDANGILDILLGKVIGPTIDDFINQPIVEITSSIKDSYVKTIINTIYGIIDDAIKSVTDWKAPTLPDLNNIVNSLKEQLSGVLDKNFEIIQNRIDSFIEENIQPVFDNINGMFESINIQLDMIEANIDGKIKSIQDQAEAKINEIKNQVEQQAQSASNNIQTQIQEQVSTVEQKVQTQIDSAQTELNNLMQDNADKVNIANDELEKLNTAYQEQLKNVKELDIQQQLINEYDSRKQEIINYIATVNTLTEQYKGEITNKIESNAAQAIPFIQTQIFNEETFFNELNLMLEAI